MNNILFTLSHYIYLTKKQRDALQRPGEEVEVIGACSPVWMKNGDHLTQIAEEVFARYKIKHCPGPEKQTINAVPGGFQVNLSPDMPIFLADVPDGGSMSLGLTHKNFIEYRGKSVPVLHYFNAEDISVLEKTIF